MWNKLNVNIKNHVLYVYIKYIEKNECMEHPETIYSVS